ncbi:MAG: VCBS repeat-containing protein [Planctomycetes bacterium]|nr:VCBS repeat-containing protein [Planctomycetota bacterium]
MAGLFQVLWGKPDRKFGKAKVLNGSDGEPLLLPSGGGGGADVTKICTRAFAVDLDADGDLDLVSGNFRGTFAWFEGLGGGKFAAESKWIEGGSGLLRNELQVDAHSDPFLVDWDGDGDFDLLSGSAQGGAFLFPNEGTKSAPRFGARVTLLEPAGHAPGGGGFGEAQLKGPGASTRVWADDIDGDGKLDLLVGDSVTLQFPLEGNDEAKTRELLTAWDAEQAKLMEKMVPRADGSLDEAAQEAWQKHYETRKDVVREEMTGFVWLLRGK